MPIARSLRVHSGTIIIEGSSRPRWKITMKNSQLPGALGALFAVAWLSCTSASANPPMPLLITLRPAVQPLLQIKDKGREEEDNRKKKNQGEERKSWSGRGQARAGGERQSCSGRGQTEAG